MAQKRAVEDGGFVLTVRPIAYEALARLQEKLVIPSLITRDYQQYFADKIGDTVDVLMPYYTRSHDGRTLQDSDISKMIQRMRQVKVDKWRNVAFEYNAEDLMLSLANFGDYFLDSGCEELAHAADEACANALGTELFYHDGTAGTQIGVSEAQDVAAHADWVSIPQAGRFALVDPTDFGAISKDLQEDIYNPQLVSDAVRQRYKGTLAEFGIFRSANIPNMSVADYGTATPQINAAAGYEGGELPTNGWPSSVTKILNKGQLIQIDGVYEATRRGERKSTGRLMTFTVKEDTSCDALGNATIKIEPELNAGTLMAANAAGTANQISLAGFQNVMQKAADDKAIRVLGTKGVAYRQSIWGIPQMGTFVNVMVAELPGSKAAGQTAMAYDEQTNLSLTIHSEPAVFPDLAEKMRADTFFGATAIYPDVGIRLLSGSAGAAVVTP